MNMDLKMTLCIFGYWIEIQFFEIDWDSQWGLCLGLFKIRYNNNGDRSLLQWVDTKHRTSFRLFFINLFEHDKN